MPAGRSIPLSNFVLSPSWRWGVRLQFSVMGRSCFLPPPAASSHRKTHANLPLDGVDGHMEHRKKPKPKGGSSWKITTRARL